MDELEKQYMQQQREAQHFLEWLRMGLARGWVSDPYCVAHSEPPLTMFEKRQFAAGKAPCVTNVRLLLAHDGPRYVRGIDHADESRPE